MHLSLRRKHALARPATIPGDAIAVFGKVRNGPLVLDRRELEKLPGGTRIPDIRAFAEGENGRAVSFSAIVAAAAPLPGTLYVNFEDRKRTKRFSHFLAEIAELGWIAYTGGPEEAGPLRLVLPGIHGSRGRMNDLAWIEFADNSYQDPRSRG